VSDDQLTAAEPFLPARVAEPLFVRLGPLRDGQDGTFLCHNECGLGAIPLLDALRGLREFLEENPDEVITLIIQDAISPAESPKRSVPLGSAPTSTSTSRAVPGPRSAS
jgi:hypothetical protein